MKIFLTGATGFVGGRMARLLVQRGHQVHAVVRTPAKAADLAALGVHLHPGDVTAKESMRAAMAGAEAVLHIAGWYKVGVRDTREGHAITGVPAPALFGALSKLSALVEPFLTLPESYTAEGLRVVAGTTYIGNKAKARRELGYAPRPLVVGLRETLHHEMRLLGMKV